MSAATVVVLLASKNESTGKTVHKKISPADLTRSKLCSFSTYAAKRLEWGTGNGKVELVLDADTFDAAAVSKILNAMVNDNVIKPIALNVTALKPASFDELVQIHCMTKKLGIVSAFKGNDIRNTIVEGLSRKPISFYRFQHTIENLHFDRGLTNFVKRKVMKARIHGEQDKDEFSSIRQDCYLHNDKFGLWDEMEAIRVPMLQEMEKEAEAKEEVDYEEQLPALPHKKA